MNLSSSLSLSWVIYIVFTFGGMIIRAPPLKILRFIFMSENFVQFYFHEIDIFKAKKIPDLWIRETWREIRHRLHLRCDREWLSCPNFRQNSRCLPSPISALLLDRGIHRYPLSLRLWPQGNLEQRSNFLKCYIIVSRQE